MADVAMGEDTSDGTERSGEPEGIDGQKQKPGVVEDTTNSQRMEEPVSAAAVIEDTTNSLRMEEPVSAAAVIEDTTNSQRMEEPVSAAAVIEDTTNSRRMEEPVSAAAVIEDTTNTQRMEVPVSAAGGDDQIESSLVSELGALNPGTGRSEVEMEEGFSHLFTDAMKLQLRAQILVLGDFLKGIAPNPDWLEDACLESAIGAESVLLEPVDVPRGSQGGRSGNACTDDIPAESNLQRISSAFRDAEARMSPFSGGADVPIINDAIRHELHSTGTLSTLSRPSSSGRETDGLAQDTEIDPAGQLLITYDPARSNSSVPEDSRAIENLILDNDKHLDLAQASAQDALTTATSALAQSHLVWARMHSQDHSEEGIARDARLASVAATVAAASSVAKAAVEAARAIAEVSMDAFFQASGYQLGEARTPQFGSSRSTPLQVDGWEQSPFSNARENLSPSQHRAEMLESVVQAAGKAAEAATQAGVVLAKANPMVQTAGLSEFWSQKANNAVVEPEADEMYVAIEMNRLDGEDQVGALNEMDALDEMETVQEKDTSYHDKLDAVNDAREQVIATEEEGVDVAAANGDLVVRANELGDPFEQGNRPYPRTRKTKRGRGRSWGVSSRAKRAKIVVGVSSPPFPAPSASEKLHEEVNISESPDDVRDENAKEATHGAALVENAPSSITGKDATAQGQNGVVTHETGEVLESQEKARERSSEAQNRGVQHIDTIPVGSIGEDAPASAPDRSPEGETPKQDSVSASRKNVRGKKRVAKHAAKKSVRATASAAQSRPEEEGHKQDDASTVQEKGRGNKRGAKHMESNAVNRSVGDASAGKEAIDRLETELPKLDNKLLKSRKVVLGKKRGTKHIEDKPVSTAEEDIPARAAPAQTPENDELHKKDESPKTRKRVQVGNARGRTRSVKRLENQTVSTSGMVAADRDTRGPETVASTLQAQENALAEGSAVEVMIDEVGLRGGWFSGTVLRATEIEVFVELLDLLTDDGKSNVREWFPVVEGFNSHQPRRHARPVHPFTIFSEAGSRKRRRVALGSQTWHIGDQVDAFIQDAWWEGLVAEINDLDPTKATVYFPEENDTQIVKTFNLRPSFEWKDQKWIPWKSAGLVLDESSQKRTRTAGGPNKVATTHNEAKPKGRSSEERAAEGPRKPKAVREAREARPAEEQQKQKHRSKTAPPLSRRPNWKKKLTKESPGRRGRSSSSSSRAAASKVGSAVGLSPRRGASKRMQINAAVAASQRRRRK